MRMFKVQSFIFLIIFVRNSSCAIDALYDTGKKLWNLYSVLNRANIVSMRNPRTVEELFGVAIFDNHEANIDIVNRMLLIHGEINITETAINRKIFADVLGISTSNALIVRCVDQMEIFVTDIDENYKKFYEIIIKEGYVPNYQIGDLTISVFPNIESNIRKIRKIMTTAEELLPKDENFIAAIANSLAIQRETLCGDIQPITGILVQLFQIAIIAEIKTSLILSFAYIYQYPESLEWKVSNNYAGIQFQRYFVSYIIILKENLKAIEDLYVRACDPPVGNWILDKYAYELNGMTKAVIFQYDWTKCSSELCDDVWQNNRARCKARFHDARSGCASSFEECEKLYSVKACVLKEGPRKFHYVNSTVLGLFGDNSKCPGNNGYIVNNTDSKYRTCACNCNENYYRISTSIMETRLNSNKVITGLRFILKYNILFIQPRMGKLGENSCILPDPGGWLRIPDDTEGFKLRLLNIQESLFFLNDLRLPSGFVLTGVKLNKVRRESLDGFAIEIFGVPFDYKSGRLDYSGRISFSESANNLGPKIDFTPINPMKTNLLNKPSLGDQMYIQLKQSSLKSDFGQSILPLFDAVPVRPNPPSALGGIGIFHKGVEGYAGFMSLRVYGIRCEEYFENFTSAHMIDGRLQLFTQLQDDRR